MANLIKKTTKKTIPCNICSYPAMVTYWELEDGIRVQKSHMVQCLGHEGLHNSLWNKSIELVSDESKKWGRVVGYDEYRKLLLKQRKASGRKTEDNGEEG